MKYTIKYVSLVNNNYVTLNVGDIVTGISESRAPYDVVILRINKTKRNF